jgi:HEPN domain-containing protein
MVDMSNLYTSILYIAKLDYKAATVLASNGLFAQALFYAEQSFEKANKSVIVYYKIVHRGIKQEEVDREIKKEFGHFNRRATAKVIKILIDKEKEKYLSMGGSENDEFITKPYQLLEEFQKNNIKEDLIPYFNNAINRIYYNYYIHFSGKTTDQSIDPKMRYLRDQYANPTSRYQSLSWLLSTYLDGLDIYARYPINELQYNNIKFLNIPENKNACHLLLEMVGDFLEVIPLVWEKIAQLPHDKNDPPRPETIVTEADVVSFYNDV